MKTIATSIRIAVIGAIALHGTAVIAGAQNCYRSQGNGNPTVTTLTAAQAAAYRTAVLKAQLIELLRRRQLAAQIIAVQNTRRSAQIDSPQQLISKLNSLSAADVNALMSRPNILDQFTPNWVKNAPGGNVLAQFGIGNGLMKELGTSDLKKILDPRGLDAIRGKLRQAQILGNIAGGQAAQNKVYNDVQKNQNLLLAEMDRAEAMRRLYELVARTGIDPNL